jgi:hypothetical protein
MVRAARIQHAAQQNRQCASLAVFLSLLLEKMLNRRRVDCAECNFLMALLFTAHHEQLHPVQQNPQLQPA